MAQYPESLWLLGGIGVCTVGFVALLYWLIFCLPPLPETAPGTPGESKKDK